MTSRKRGRTAGMRGMVEDIFAFHFLCSSLFQWAGNDLQFQKPFKNKWQSPYTSIIKVGMWNTEK